MGVLRVLSDFHRADAMEQGRRWGWLTGLFALRTGFVGDSGGVRRRSLERCESDLGIPRLWHEDSPGWRWIGMTSTLAGVPKDCWAGQFHPALHSGVERGPILAGVPGDAVSVAGMGSGVAASRATVVVVRKERDKRMSIERRRAGGGWVGATLAAWLLVVCALGRLCGAEVSEAAGATRELAAVLFLDVGNPDCAGLEQELESFAKARGLRLEVSVKHAPAVVERIGVHEALEAARAAGKFREMQAALFRNPGVRGSGLVRLAGEVGLDVAAFESAMDNRVHRRAVMRDLAEARGLGVQTTPVLFANGARMEGGEAIRKALRTPPPKPPPAWSVMKVEPLELDLRGVPSRGPAEAPVAIVEFTDFRCGFCRIHSRTLSELEAAFPGKVRRVFKNYPLGREEEAVLPHLAGMAALEQGKFWELHHSIMSRPVEGVGDLLERAQALGLETNRLARRWVEGDVAARVDRDGEEGQRLGIEATPTTFINGRRVVGRQSIETLKGYVREALGLGVEAGVGPRLAGASGLDPDSTSLGPKDGAVYLEVFVDLAEKESGRLLERVREFARERPSVRVEFRSVVRTNGTASVVLQESALAAAEQGRFWEWCGVLAREEVVPGAERMAELARGLGMDPAKLAQSMAEHRHRARIEADTAEALERGVAGGTVVMNGTVFRGEPTQENLARHMDEHACCGKAADFQRPKGLPGR